MKSFCSQTTQILVISCCCFAENGYKMNKVQRTAAKCTKFENSRVELLFRLLDLVFCHVLVAVFVVVCLKSLIDYLARRQSTCSFLITVQVSSENISHALKARILNCREIFQASEMLL